MRGVLLVHLLQAWSGPLAGTPGGWVARGCWVSWPACCSGALQVPGGAT